MKIFVPGRICLFGEHSDWAGGYRRTNAGLDKGCALITGTDQGLYATVRPHPSKLIFTSSLDGGGDSRFEMPMESSALLAEAQKGGRFSYVAGVAYQVLTHYRVRGLEIDNYKTDLPVSKGLSSSAAVSVLVARAFNRVYDLKMTVRGEMEFAYLGEITTPSRCGRMDQGCAYGQRPIMMTFDGERIDVEEIRVGRDLHFVIVDLNASKDTVEILKMLSRSYPFADDDVQEGVQQYLGPTNARVVHDASEALREGDAERVGLLMREAQRLFDQHLAPACPSQLEAPVLHHLLGYDPIQPLILGGKGVGSQGDGSAQLLVRNESDQQKVIDIIERDLGMPCLELTVLAGRQVRKAVVPAAGFGTRVFPASKAMKKELFPVIDRDGRIKPAIMVVIEEAMRSGIEEVCLVVQSEDRHLFEDFFHAPPPAEHYNKLSREDQAYCNYIMDVGRRVSFVYQEVQEGFGHAVYCAREWVKGDPFLLMLGDHLFSSSTDTPCARQLLDVYERVGRSVVGLKMTPGADIHSFGCAAGIWAEPHSLLSITEFAEKPELDYAREHLAVDGLEPDTFLSLFGLYVLEATVFDYLEEHIRHNKREGGEFQLTSCLDCLRQEAGFAGYVVQGQRYDIGQPDSYVRTITEFAKDETG